MGSRQQGRGQDFALGAADEASSRRYEGSNER
jgi:hypothetical protein